MVEDAIRVDDFQVDEFRRLCSIEGLSPQFDEMKQVITIGRFSVTYACVDQLVLQHPSARVREILFQKIMQFFRDHPGSSLSRLSYEFWKTKAEREAGWISHPSR